MIFEFSKRKLCVLCASAVKEINPPVIEGTDNRKDAKYALTYRASNSAGSSYCSITIEVLPELNIQHITGIGDGDTLHVADCLPPGISGDELDLGVHEGRSKIGTRVFARDLPTDPLAGLWNIRSYEYEVTDYCGRTRTFQNYLALYDLSPPMFLGFPVDVWISSTSQLPPISEEVRILDLCRYVVWDTLTTTTVLLPSTGDTMAFVRRWEAEDVVGNRGFRDQVIYVGPYNKNELGGLSLHVARESDLLNAHFPEVAVANSIPVVLHRLDSLVDTTTVFESQFTSHLQGRHGQVFFTSIPAGMYRVEVAIPEGYTLVSENSLFSGDGWSDTLWIGRGKQMHLGTLLLVEAEMEDDIAKVEEKEEGIGEGITENTGIRQVIGSSFVVYPNPTSGRVSLNTPDLETWEYELNNALGLLVKRGMGSHGTVIDLDIHKNGMYMIRLKSENRIIGIQRIMVVNEMN